MADATDGRLKCFVGVSVKARGLKAWFVGRHQLQRKSDALWIATVLWVSAAVSPNSNAVGVTVGISIFLIFLPLLGPIFLFKSDIC